MTHPGLRALLEYLPPAIRRHLGRLRRMLKPRPESTFIRVAYTTPRQVVLVTTRHEGADNVWPVDSHVVLSFIPGMFGIAVNRQGYGSQLVRKSGVFVVNFVPATWEKIIFDCGAVSGRSVDKFAMTGLRKEEAQSVDAPRLADSLGVLECKVQQTIEVGDHTFFIGEVTHSTMRLDAPRLHHVDSRLRTNVAGEGGDGPQGATSRKTARPG